MTSKSINNHSDDGTAILPFRGQQIYCSGEISLTFLSKQTTHSELMPRAVSDAG